MMWLHPDGVFNASYLRNATEVILTDNPLDALMLITSCPFGKRA
jgi:hypothetical protein